MTGHTKEAVPLECRWGGWGAAVLLEGQAARSEGQAARSGPGGSGMGRAPCAMRHVPRRLQPVPACPALPWQWNGKSTLRHAPCATPPSTCACLPGPPLAVEWEEHCTLRHAPCATRHAFNLRLPARPSPGLQRGFAAGRRHQRAGVSLPRQLQPQRVRRKPRGGGGGGGGVRVTRRCV